MKRALVFLSAILLFFGVLGVANAKLWDRGGGLIYDDVLEITWLQDAYYTGTTMNWADAVSWAGALSYYDSVRDVYYDDWRLPDARNQDGSGPDGMINATGSEMGHMFYNNLGGTYPSFPETTFMDGNGNIVSIQHLQSGIYWASNEHIDHPDSIAWGFNFNNGVQTFAMEADSYFAWAVREGDVVPIPGAVYLLGSGLIGIVGIRRKFKK